jgi:hypothetical protein
MRQSISGVFVLISVALTAELSAGIFSGGDEGLFGQFHDNSFVKLGLQYTF